MDMGVHFQFFILLIVLKIKSVFLLDLGLVKSIDNYGPFEIEVIRYETCKGPKARNSAVPYFYFDKVINKKGDSDYVYRGNITFLENTELSETRIKVLTVKGNKKTILLKYSVKQPCQHFMIAKIIEKVLNATGCTIKKATYNFSMSYMDLLESFFGKSFFYGEYEIRATTTAPKGNIVCIIINLAIKKPEKMPSV